MFRRHFLYGCFLLAISFRAVSSAATCRPEERAALLDFLKPFEIQPECSFTFNTSLDCCSWSGIECGKTSGHVHSISLSCLRGPILPNSGIFKLSFLKTLVLSGDFQLSSIPNEVGKLTKLRRFQMVESNLSGTIPTGLCNLKSVRILRLRENSLTGRIPSCLFGLSNLVELALEKNRLVGPIPDKVGNLNRLNDFRLKNNQIDGKVPSWLFTLPSLSVLDLSFNQLTGPFEPFNQPVTTVLSEIVLNNNRLRGPVPINLFQLVNLTFLDLSVNQLSGVLEWSSLEKMRSIRMLSLSENRGLSFKNSKNASTLRFPDLWHVNVSYCNTTEFPTSLLAVNGLSVLDISHNQIGGRIFPKGSGWWKELNEFHASHNRITGFEEFPRWIRLFDLSFNLLQGPLPNPHQFLFGLLLSNNKLSGELPPRFCDATELTHIDLSFNNFRGVLPSCLMNRSSLTALNLQSNSFHGPIPDISATPCNLLYLVLSDNNFQGTIPRSLNNCILHVLDVGNNNITDTFPDWLEDSLLIQIIILRSNKFFGGIRTPTVENPFRSLQILDLSTNSFSGSIPDGFIANLGFLKNLTTNGNTGDYVGQQGENPWDSKWRIRVFLKYSKFNQDPISHSSTILDFSSNHFTGSIPSSFGELKALKVLDLSENTLSGIIPSSLGNIIELESLDLSRNKLGGKIPQVLMDLEHLESFNVSYNNLEGKIPTGKRSALFSASSYIGNPGLCGSPLSKLC